MRIEHVSQPFRLEMAKKADAAQKKNRPQQAGRADRAELSSDGKLLSETRASVEVTKPHVAVAPEIRSDRVEEVRQKIENGFYDSPEFADQLAGKLIDDMGKELGLS